MAKPITNPSNIPLGVRDQMKEAVMEVAARAGIEMPGQAPEDVNLQRFMALFEKCTRILWTEEIKRIEARKAIIAATYSEDNDIFEEDTTAPTPPVQRPQ